MEYEDRVRIATPEGVDVELTLAGIGSRFIAAFFDFAIQWSVIIASGILLGVIGGGGRDWVFLLGAVGAAGGGWENAVFAIIFFVVFFGYDVLFEVRARGRTPGKRWTGLRVVRTGGQPVTLVPSCVRNVMRLVDFLPVMYGVGMTSIFVTSRNQRLGDLAGGTLVMRERPASLKSSATNGAHAAFPRRRRLGRQRRLGAGHRHGAAVPRPPRDARRRSRAPSSPRSSNAACGRASPARQRASPPRSSSSGWRPRKVA